MYKILALLLLSLTLTAQPCDNCPPQSDVDEENPDFIEREESDWYEPDDPTYHVPGQVGPFGE